MEWYSPVDNGEVKDVLNSDKSLLYSNRTKTHSPILSFNQYRKRQLSKGSFNNNDRFDCNNNMSCNPYMSTTYKPTYNFESSNKYKYQNDLPINNGWNSDYKWNDDNSKPIIDNRFKSNYMFNTSNDFKNYDSKYNLNETNYLNSTGYTYLSPLKHDTFTANCGPKFGNGYDYEYKSPVSDYRTTIYDYKTTNPHDYNTDNNEYVNYVPAYDAKISKITKIPMYNNVTIPSFSKYDSLEYTSPIYKRKSQPSSNYYYKSPVDRVPSERVFNNYSIDNYTNKYTSKYTSNMDYAKNKYSNDYDNFKYDKYLSSYRKTPSDTIKRPYSDTHLFNTTSPTSHERSERSEILKSNGTEFNDSNRWAKKQKGIESKYDFGMFNPSMFDQSSKLFDHTPHRKVKSGNYFPNYHDDTKYANSPYHFDNIRLFDSTPKRNRSLLSTPVKPWNSSPYLFKQ